MDLNWIDLKKASQADKEKNQILKYLSGHVKCCSNRNKIYYKRLSPGCAICGMGKWSVLFINEGRCTANCFYCPEKSSKHVNPPHLHDWRCDGPIFDNPDDYMDYLDKFGFKGVAFSGGEPLMVIDKLVVYLEKIKRRFRKGIYTWMCTNGDLFNDERLKRLKKAGLDEIRVNISSRDYDVKRVELARQFIRSVLIEIPAIPEDYEKVRDILPELERIGIDGLILHQLYANPQNQRNLSVRDYTFFHIPNAPVLESELTALRLIKYTLENNLKVPINYCSTAYLQRNAGIGARLKSASLLKEDFEWMTRTGYIGRLTIKDSAQRLKKIIDSLDKKGVSHKLWFLNKKDLYLHPSALKQVRPLKSQWIVEYFAAPFNSSPSGNGTNYKEYFLNPRKAIYIERMLEAQVKGLQLSDKRNFEKRYVSRENDVDIFKYSYKNYMPKKQKSVIDTLFYLF